MTIGTTKTATTRDDATAQQWEPQFSPWRHGGWYIDNLRYPSGAVGCVSRNYPDKKWRIVCDPRPEESRPTFPSRIAAAYGERELIAAMLDGLRDDVLITDHGFVPQDDYNVRLCGMPDCGYSKSQHRIPEKSSDPAQPSQAVGGEHDLALPWTSTGMHLKDNKGRIVMTLTSAIGTFSNEQMDKREEFVLTAVNSHKSLVAALEQARNVLYDDDPATAKAIAMIDAALTQARGGA